MQFRINKNLNKMVVTSHGSVHGSMHMFEVVCFVCRKPVKLEEKTSRINGHDCSSFVIEDELKKVSDNCYQ